MRSACTHVHMHILQHRAHFRRLSRERMRKRRAGHEPLHTLHAPNVSPRKCCHQQCYCYKRGLFWGLQRRFLLLGLDWLLRSRWCSGQMKAAPETKALSFDFLSSIQPSLAPPYLFFFTPPPMHEPPAFPVQTQLCPFDALAGVAERFEFFIQR